MNSATFSVVLFKFHSCYLERSFINLGFNSESYDNET